VGSITSHNPIGLHGLFYLLIISPALYGMALVIVLFLIITLFGQSCKRILVFSEESALPLLELQFDYPFTPCSISQLILHLALFIPEYRDNTSMWNVGIDLQEYRMATQKVAMCL
jgi:hypothetical protein